MLSDQHRSERRAEPLRQAQRYAIVALGQTPDVDAERRSRVEQPRAVEMGGELALARKLATSARCSRGNTRPANVFSIVTSRVIAKCGSSSFTAA
jgi:hypothetical protein